jgi:hypothetical protein
VKSKLSWHSDSRVTVNQRISGVLSLHASFDSYMKWLKVDSGISFRWVNTNSFRMMSSHLVWYDHLRRTIIEDYPYITAGKLNFAVSHEVCCAFYFECFIGCTTNDKEKTHDSCLLWAPFKAYDKVFFPWTLPPLKCNCPKTKTLAYVFF